MFDKLKRRASDPQAFTLPITPKGAKTEVQLLSKDLAEVEGCLGLVTYTESEIGMEILEGRLFICGKDLELKLYREKRVAIIGTIQSLRFEESKSLREAP